MNFFSLYDQNYARVAACNFPLALGNPSKNASQIIAMAEECHTQGIAILTFPELCLSGYSLDDLFQQHALIETVTSSITDICEATKKLLPVLVIGAPLKAYDRLYNTAVVIHHGKILGIVPKTYLPNYAEFYEVRQFASGFNPPSATVTMQGLEIAFGNNLLFEVTDIPNFTFHASICEDIWVPVSPLAVASLQGATLLVNLSGSPAIIGKARQRLQHCLNLSAQFRAAIVFSAAGVGESTTDLSWDGQSFICEEGQLLASSERFHSERTLVVADIDLQQLSQSRQGCNTFLANDNNLRSANRYQAPRRICFALQPPRQDLGLLRTISRFPFVPDDTKHLQQDCEEAFNIQVHALSQRLKSIGHPRLILGLSGGLDSTHALLVALRTIRKLQLKNDHLLVYALPGFGTSEQTSSNAQRLCQALDLELYTIDIRPAALRMLKDIGHPYTAEHPIYDVTFENVQAGLRTDYLFRLASQHQGLVLGTGDLSELALGWCTYGVGDQMSHYAVNAGLPKTLIQHLIRWVASQNLLGSNSSPVLEDILATEISPELVPAEAGKGPQSTEAIIGPYELHDFTLYYFLHRGLLPSRIAFMAWHAWHDAKSGIWPEHIKPELHNSYALDTIVKWEETFLRRFFANQFKRSALPNGPKIANGGALSPRGDWRMPSDAEVDSWLAELKKTTAEVLS